MSGEEEAPRSPGITNPGKRQQRFIPAKMCRSDDLPSDDLLVPTTISSMSSRYSLRSQTGIFDGPTWHPRRRASETGRHHRCPAFQPTPRAGNRHRARGGGCALGACRLARAGLRLRRNWWRSWRRNMRRRGWRGGGRTLRGGWRGSRRRRFGTGRRRGAAGGATRALKRVGIHLEEAGRPLVLGRGAGHWHRLNSLAHVSLAAGGTCRGSKCRFDHGCPITRRSQTHMRSQIQT